MAVPIGSTPKDFANPDANLPPYIRVSGTNTGDLEAGPAWLKSCKVETVAQREALLAGASTLLFGFDHCSMFETPFVILWVVSHDACLQPVGQGAVPFGPHEMGVADLRGGRRVEGARGLLEQVGDRDVAARRVGGGLVVLDACRQQILLEQDVVSNLVVQARQYLPVTGILDELDAQARG